MNVASRQLHAPPTRFQGSKYKLLGWLGEHLAGLNFQTCLDAFSGSASVSHFLKQQGKSVTCNDALTCCTHSAIALVENDAVELSDDDIEFVMTRRPNVAYDDVIARNFDGVYFTADENVWLDIAAQNIPHLPGRYKQSLAWHALFQSAMAKRPYNLFHRANLYMRLASVQRTFGNKATWDKPFDQHFRQHARAANAAVFQSAPCRAISGDANNVEGDFDLVYIDPPYINQNGVGVDYHGFYHFLEGLADYPNWASRIDYASKHRRLKPMPSRWTNKAMIHHAFAELFTRYRRSILAVSYRSDGIPTVEELRDLLLHVKSNVSVHTLDRGYKYALSTNGKSSEALLIGRA